MPDRNDENCDEDSGVTNRKRKQERDVDYLLWELDNIKKTAKERELKNEKRIEKLEKEVESFIAERVKWGGAFMMLIAIGSFLLWLSSVGSNVSKVIK